MCLFVKKVRRVSLPLYFLFLLHLSPSLSLPPVLRLHFCDAETVFTGGEHVSALLLSRNLPAWMSFTLGHPWEALARVNACHTRIHMCTESSLCVCVFSSSLQCFLSIRARFRSETNLSRRLEPQTVTTVPSPFSSHVPLHLWILLSSGYIIHPHSVDAQRESEWMNFPTDHSYLSTWKTLLLF